MCGLRAYNAAEEARLQALKVDEAATVARMPGNWLMGTATGPRKYAPDVVAPAMMFNQSTKSVDLVNQLSIADGGEDHTAIAVGEGGATGIVGYVLGGFPVFRTFN
jgi:hypothetical protein